MSSIRCRLASPFPSSATQSSPLVVVKAVLCFPLSLQSIYYESVYVCPAAEGSCTMTHNSFGLIVSNWAHLRYKLQLYTLHTDTAIHTHKVVQTLIYNGSGSFCIQFTYNPLSLRRCRCRHCRIVNSRSLDMKRAAGKQRTIAVSVFVRFWLTLFRTKDNKSFHSIVPKQYSLGAQLSRPYPFPLNAHQTQFAFHRNGLRPMSGLSSAPVFSKVT